MIDQGWTDARKGRYDDKCVKVDTRVICTRAVRETADGEKYSERLILRSMKTVNLVQESKHRFGLVVRLIANKCHENTFYFLSFLPTVLTLPSSSLRTCLISLHWIIRGIIWLARSYLELPTSAESFVTLQTRPKVRTSETR